MDTNKVCDMLVQSMVMRRENLRREADAFGGLIADVVRGNQWRNVVDIDLVLGAVYVVRRKYTDGYGEPGLSRWTSHGWRDEFGRPLHGGGNGVEVLV